MNVTVPELERYDNVLWKQRLSPANPEYRSGALGQGRISIAHDFNPEIPTNIHSLYVLDEVKLHHFRGLAISKPQKYDYSVLLRANSLRMWTQQTYFLMFNSECKSEVKYINITNHRFSLVCSSYSPIIDLPRALSNMELVRFVLKDHLRFVYLRISPNS